MFFNVKELCCSVDETDFSDITNAVQIGPAKWMDEGLAIPFSRDLTQTEIDAITLRITVPKEEEPHHERTKKALTDNSSWRTNILPPLITNADQIIATTGATAQAKDLARAVKTLARQVEDLTYQNDALIKLVRKEF